MVDGVTGDAVPASAGPARRPPFVSVVVATRDRSDKLVRCVQSLLDGDQSSLEVVVVDNAPADTSTRDVVAARWADDLRVRYLCEPRPGAARARNVGIQAADGEIVAFTDDDVVTDPSWLRLLTDEFANDDVCAVAGLTVPLRLDTAASVWFEQVSAFGRGAVRATCTLRDDPPPTRLFPFTPPFGATNNLAVRKSIVRAVGGFDERLGPGTPTRGGEDLDLLARLILTGGTLVYRPDALVRHEHRDSVVELRSQMFTYGAGNTAVITKWALRNPDLRRALLRLVLTAARPSSGSAARTGADADSQPPTWLRRTIRFGYVAGPWLWLRSSVTNGDGGGGMSLRARTRGARAPQAWE